MYLPEMMISIYLVLWYLKSQASQLLLVSTGNDVFNVSRAIVFIIIILIYMHSQRLGGVVVERPPRCRRSTFVESGVKHYTVK